MWSRDHPVESGPRPRPGRPPSSTAWPVASSSPSGSRSGLLYAGVLLLTSGVGVLVAERQQEIGPLAIAGGIALASAACLVCVARQAARFSWRGRSPNVAFDYILLLGLLLFASDLGYMESQFTVLGPRWPYHLLIVGVVYLLVAYRWDSRTALGCRSPRWRRGEAYP